MALPSSGRRYRIEADEAERAATAVRLGIPAISSLTASFDLAPRAGGIILVTGVVEASLTQTCVVTLAPVEASVKEEVEARFTTVAPGLAPPKAAAAPGAKARAVAEEQGGLDEEDPPDEARDGQIDIGELAVVHLALGLDPYPRAPGAAFKPGSWGGDDGKGEAEGAFAALAKLKPKDPPREGQ